MFRRPWPSIFAFFSILFLLVRFSLNNASFQPDFNIGIQIMEDRAANRISEKDFTVCLRDLDSSPDFGHFGQFLKNGLGRVSNISYSSLHNIFNPPEVGLATNTVVNIVSLQMNDCAGRTQTVQAALALNPINIVRLITSPLRRAQKTAEYLAPKNLL